MCLGIPGQVVSLENAGGLRMGRVRFGEIVREACLEYVPEVAEGDYVIVHAGFAISRVDEQEAARTYQLLEEMGQLAELDQTDTDTEPGRDDSTDEPR
ncbi:MAG TPA: HypC/HybG/HupF family hydrogenase formation chaperone [Terriglobia bacterium]|nr:HypC/HybG/HupF family hydrogenase formation chaperone [Terriglobia bacterium]